MTHISNRSLIGSFTIPFIISTTILLIASTARTPAPAWRSYFFLSILPHAILLWAREPSL